MRITKALLVFWMLIIIALLAYASDELIWTPANLPGLEIAGSPTMNLGIWFYGDFGWLNSGKQLWITQDAGRNWKLSLLPPERGGLFYDSYFINSLEGWALPYTFPVILFHTEDGGVTWKELKVKLTQTSDKPVNPDIIVLTRIYCRDSLHGLGAFAIASGDVRPPEWLDGIIAYTEDGGEHWAELSRGPVLPRMIGFDEQVWIVSQIGKAYYTSDFGDTFRQISIPTIEPTHLVFASPLYGWLAVDNFRVLKTTDGCNTWSEPIFTRIGSKFWSGVKGLCLMSENLGVISWYSRSEEVDGPSLLYVTYNGGVSWLSYYIPDRAAYKLGYNRKRMEVWLFPIGSIFSEKGGIFYTPIEMITSIQPSSKIFTTWALLKKTRKEL